MFELRVSRVRVMFADSKFVCSTSMARGALTFVRNKIHVRVAAFLII